MITQPDQLSPVIHNNSTWKNIKRMLPMILFLLLLAGGAIAYFLAQQSQEIRQQASVERTTTKIVTESSTGEQTVYLDQKNSITLTAQIPTQTQITGIQYIAQLSGPIPTDMVFTPANIVGLNATKTTLEPTATGQKLTILFLTTPPNVFKVTESDIILGTLSFTPSQTGKLTITPDPGLTKIINSTNNSNLISGVEFSEYSIVKASSTPTPTPIESRPTPTPTNESRPTPTPIESRPTPTATPTPTPADSRATPTASPVFTTQPTPSATPNVTARPTATPTPTATPAPKGSLCNELCITDADCMEFSTGFSSAQDLICYYDESRGGRCRLKTNPTSTTCQPATATPTPTPTPDGSRATPTPIPTIGTDPTPTPTASPVVYLSADINKDGVVDIQDFSYINGTFLEEGTDLPADIDGNGIVDLQDYSIWNSAAQL